MFLKGHPEERTTNHPVDESLRLKFFINPTQHDDASKMYRHYFDVPEERVFIHPASALFNVGSYSYPWLVYHTLVKTSKSYVRDATECSAYALLLFGGKLEVQAGQGLIVVEDWARFSANARIGALIGGLRRVIDELLLKKIEEPEFDIVSTTEMKLVRNLLVTDGVV